LGLVTDAECVDAVEPSAEMLAIAQQRLKPNESRVSWIHAPAEVATFQGPYSLAIAAESLHWMEWSLVLPKVAAALAPRGVLVLAERASIGRMPWDDELATLIAKYSTNQEYHPYDLVQELTTRGLFTAIGRRTTSPAEFCQSIDDHIESMHSRNGFSRQRMTRDSAKEFDDAFRRLLERACSDGIVRLQTIVNVIWGNPRGIA
jgi:ubiquinone/menaquinone biosynthesis C-methylase UbiE